MKSTDFQGTVWKQAAVLRHLEGIFRSVCAYCECPYVAGYPAVEHYRPKAALKNDPAGHKGYYWLAYADSNYRFACTPCNTKKSSLFPIAGQRANGPNDNLALELPFLVDPCEVQDPDEHFQFQPNGQVLGLTEAGRKTISLLVLNRDILVQQRRTHWDFFKNSINSVIATGDPRLVIFPTPPTYLGVFRAVIRELRRTSNQPQFFDDLLDLVRLL